MSENTIKTNTIAPQEKSMSVVKQYKNRLGLSNEEITQRVISEYQEGKIMRIIAEEYGMTLDAVRRILRHNGISPSGRLVKNGITSTKERDEKILEKRMEGKTYETIAEELEICKSVVYRVCKESGVNEQMRLNKLKDVEGRILELYSKGTPPKRIKDEVHKTYEDVRSILEKNGFANGSSKLRERNERILQMRKDGISVKDIAETLGMNRFSVYHILEKMEKEKE